MEQAKLQRSRDELAAKLLVAERLAAEAEEEQIRSEQEAAHARAQLVAAESSLLASPSAGLSEVQHCSSSTCRKALCTSIPPFACRARERLTC